MTPDVNKILDSSVTFGIWNAIFRTYLDFFTHTFRFNVFSLLYSLRKMIEKAKDKDKMISM